MPESKLKKTIALCRIIAVLSAVILLILMAVMMLSSGGELAWLDGSGRHIFLGAVYLLSAGVFLPPFVILGLRLKLKSLTTDDRIKELEQEVARLKDRQRL